MGAVEHGRGTKHDISGIFGVHESFICNPLRRKREKCDIAKLPHGASAVIDAAVDLPYDPC